MGNSTKSTPADTSSQRESNLHLRQKLLNRIFQSLRQRLLQPLKTKGQAIPRLRVPAEIQNLLEVLKHMGKSGIASVGDELKQLEAERDKLQADIKSMAEQESPFQRMSEAGRAFFENWTDIGEVLEGAEPDEQRCILHHFIQSLQLSFLDAEEKRAEYSLTLFPEVGPGKFGPRNENETVPNDGDGLDVLTPEAFFCQKGEKAPRVGDEAGGGSPMKTKDSVIPVKTGAAECAAMDSPLADPQLRSIIEAWPRLSKDRRNALLEYIKNAMRNLPDE